MGVKDEREEKDKVDVMMEGRRWRGVLTREEEKEREMHVRVVVVVVVVE